MSVNDPISDMLTRLRNGLMVQKTVVAIPNSKMKMDIARILKEEGYIEDFEVAEGENPYQSTLRVKMKYVGERRFKRPVISGLERISRPGRRMYTHKQDIPWVLSGMGISILSTSKGVMTGQRARQLNVGGELLCKVW
jgi:small subunit ribosomal protein S8